jgi:DNA invertase Pin-like site-specific DNA recombinase
MFGMLSILVDYQRELTVANTRDGLAAARARGRNGGRPSKLSASTTPGNIPSRRSPG